MSGSLWSRTITGRNSPTVARTEDLVVVGHACTLYRDPDRSQKSSWTAGGLIAWCNDQSLLIDRYDCRFHLNDLSSFDQPSASRSSRQATPLTHDEQRLEKLCNDERYRDLKRDVLEDQTYEEEEMKRLQASLGTGGSEINFKYDDYNPEEPTEEEEANRSRADDEHTEDDMPFMPPPGVKFPPDTVLPSLMKDHYVIEKTASFIVQNGPQMEIVVKAKQARNRKFDFLNMDHPLNFYYRFLLKLMKEKKYVPAPPPRTVLKMKPVAPPADSDSSDDDDGGYLHPSLMAVSHATDKTDTEKQESSGVRYKLAEQNDVYSQLFTRLSALAPRHVETPPQEEEEEEEEEDEGCQAEEEVTVSTPDPENQKLQLEGPQLQASSSTTREPSAEPSLHDEASVNGAADGDGLEAERGTGEVKNDDEQEDERMETPPEDDSRDEPTGDRLAEDEGQTECSNVADGNQVSAVSEQEQQVPKVESASETPPLGQPKVPPGVDHKGFGGMPSQEQMRAMWDWYNKTAGVDYSWLSQSAVPPPPDIQPIVDKMAEYVALHGPEFEIVVKKKAKKQYDFVEPTNIYYPYYQMKIAQISYMDYMNQMLEQMYQQPPAVALANQDGAPVPPTQAYDSSSGTTVQPPELVQKQAGSAPDSISSSPARSYVNDGESLDGDSMSPRSGSSCSHLPADEKEDTGEHSKITPISFSLKPPPVSVTATATDAAALLQESDSEEGNEEEAMDQDSGRETAAPSSQQLPPAASGITSVSSGPPTASTAVAPAVDSLKSSGEKSVTVAASSSPRANRRSQHHSRSPSVDAGHPAPAANPPDGETGGGFPMFGKETHANLLLGKHADVLAKLGASPGGAERRGDSGARSRQHSGDSRKAALTDRSTSEDEATDVEALKEEARQLTLFVREAQARLRIISAKLTSQSRRRADSSRGSASPETASSRRPGSRDVPRQSAAAAKQLSPAAHHQRSPVAAQNRQPIRILGPDSDRAVEPRMRSSRSPAQRSSDSSRSSSRSRSSTPASGKGPPDEVKSEEHTGDGTLSPVEDPTPHILDDETEEGPAAPPGAGPASQSKSDYSGGSCGSLHSAVQNARRKKAALFLSLLKTDAPSAPTAAKGGNAERRTGKESSIKVSASTPNLKSLPAKDDPKEIKSMFDDDDDGDDNAAEEREEEEEVDKADRGYDSDDERDETKIAKPLNRAEDEGEEEEEEEEEGEVLTESEPTNTESRGSSPEAPPAVVNRPRPDRSRSPSLRSTASSTAAKKHKKKKKAKRRLPSSYAVVVKHAKKGSSASGKSSDRKRRKHSKGSSGSRAQSPSSKKRRYKDDRID